MFNSRRSIGKRVTPSLRTSPQGKWISTYETEGSFSLAPGSSVTIVENVFVANHSKLHFHAWLDAEITITVEWRAHEGSEWITSSSIVIPASVSAVGTIHDVIINSPYYQVTALNSDTDPLTFLKLSVYGAK